MITNLTNKKGKDMRKKTIKMMVIAGAIAMLVPTAAMAEWDQAETHNNQQDHADHAFPLTDLYGKDSMIGYDIRGDGSATTLHTYKWLAAPDYTTPCPISYENYG